MNKAEVKSLEGMFTSVMDGMKVISGSIKTLAKRVERLEAENRELRSLWAECEKNMVEHKVASKKCNRALGDILASEEPNT